MILVSAICAYVTANFKIRIQLRFFFDPIDKAFRMHDSLLVIQVTEICINKFSFFIFFYVSKKSYLMISFSGLLARIHVSNLTHSCLQPLFNLLIENIYCMKSNYRVFLLLNFTIIFLRICFYLKHACFYDKVVRESIYIL